MLAKHWEGSGVGNFSGEKNINISGLSPWSSALLCLNWHRPCSDIQGTPRWAGKKVRDPYYKRPLYVYIMDHYIHVCMYVCMLDYRSERFAELAYDIYLCYT